MSQFLSVSQVAEQTGLHPISVRRLIAKGEIPSVKLGGRRLIPATFLISLNTQAVNNISQAAAR